MAGLPLKSPSARCATLRDKTSIVNDYARSVLQPSATGLAVTAAKNTHQTREAVVVLAELKYFRYPPVVYVLDSAFLSSR